MGCRKITRWVLRHGVVGIPAEWHDHIADCAECRRVVDDVRALDTALTQSDVPDPGESYWEGFAPSVARRLEALSTTPVPTPKPSRQRWVWARTWAPAIGVAALALLIGRELSRDYTSKPVILDSQLPVQAEKLPAAEQPPSANEGAAQPVTEATEPAENGIIADRTAHQQSVPAELREESSGPTIRAADDTPRETAPEVAEAPPDQVSSSADEHIEVADVANSDTRIENEQDDDSSVWPNRRVLTLGQLGQDVEDQPTMDDRRLSEQDSPGLADRRYSWSSANGAETSGTPSALSRLEGTQTFRSAALPDSQSPTEAMRRFDELIELRQQITTLERVDADHRSQDQARELCAMWYRTGQITSDPAELDTAIARMEEYIKMLDGSLQPEWQQKKSQLVTRRASLVR